MKISIDKSRCIMCGSCAALCPEAFEMQKDGTMGTKVEEVTDEKIQAKVKDAAAACPATAITAK